MKTKVDFVWFGLRGRYGIWKDGLWAAMKLLEEAYDVQYKEPVDEIREDAIVLFWEAPITAQHPENGIWYNKIHMLPNKKILLFAGGPLEQQWMYNFDRICVESEINAQECEVQGLPYSTAFGINSDIFKPHQEMYKTFKGKPSLARKEYDGIHHGTCASWKRQWLVGEALGEKALIIGRGQESDPYPFDRCREMGSIVLPEMNPEILVDWMNKSRTCVQTSNYWGGGQRCTLEAMACGVPVIAMSDSPKNCEYVRESRFGLIVDPEISQIRAAVQQLKDNPLDPKIGRDYVLSKWTPQHYANKLIKAINSIL